MPRNKENANHEKKDDTITLACLTMQMYDHSFGYNLPPTPFPITPPPSLLFFRSHPFLSLTGLASVEPNE